MLEQPSHVLITGANGFIGSHLCGYLSAEGYQVTACMRRGASVDKYTEVLSFYKQNPTDIRLLEIDDIWFVEEAIRQFDGDTVIHTAGYVDLTGRHIKQMDKVNVKGTAAVAEACFVHHKRMIHLSSISALGDVWLPNEPITGNSQWQPDKYHSLYGISKMRAQLEVHAYIEEGLDALILCPGVVFGKGFPKAGGNPILHYLHKNKRPLCPTTGNLPWVAVDKIAQVCQWALSQESFSREPLILLDGQENYTDFYSEVFSFWNKPFKPRNVSRKLVSTLVSLLSITKYIGIRHRMTRDFLNSLFGARVYTPSTTATTRPAYSPTDLMRYLGY